MRASPDGHSHPPPTRQPGQGGMHTPETHVQIFATRTESMGQGYVTHSCSCLTTSTYTHEGKA